jgi:hypothetical protein
MMMRVLLAAAWSLLASAALGDSAKEFAKSGFFVHVHDGRLWVLREGDKDIAVVSKNEEPKVVITRIGVGPKGMTVKSNDGKVIDEYLAKK